MSPQPATNPAPLSYFVVTLDYGNYGLEAIVDPALRRADVVARIADGNYPAETIAFIHFVQLGALTRDVTLELKCEAMRIEMRRAA